MLEAPNYTQIPNQLLDNLAALTESELRVILAIARKTFGFHRETCALTVANLKGLTGMSHQGIKNAVDGLLGRKWIYRQRHNNSYSYGIRFDHMRPVEDADPVEKRSTKLIDPPPTPPEKRSTKLIETINLVDLDRSTKLIETINLADLSLNKDLKKDLKKPPKESADPWGEGFPTEKKNEPEPENDPQPPNLWEESKADPDPVVLVPEVAEDDFSAAPPPPSFESFDPLDTLMSIAPSNVPRDSGIFATEARLRFGADAHPWKRDKRVLGLFVDYLAANCCGSRYDSPEKKRFIAMGMLRKAGKEWPGMDAYDAIAIPWGQFMQSAQKAQRLEEVTQPSNLTPELQDLLRRRGLA